MDQKSLLLTAIQDTGFQSQCELLKAYFSEKRFAVVIRSERLAFSTFVTAVMVNSERFSQAKGKSKEESETKAVKKAWEKAVSRGKHEELEWLTERIANIKEELMRKNRGVREGKSGFAGRVARRCGGGRQRNGTVTEPISPADSSDPGLSSRERFKTPHQLDRLILAAAKVVKKQSPPEKSVGRKKKVDGLKRLHSRPFRSHLKPRLSLQQSHSFLSPLPNYPTKEESDESLSDDDNYCPTKSASIQYRSLAEARFEMKVMRGRLDRELTIGGK